MPLQRLHLDQVIMSDGSSSNPRPSLVSMLGLSAKGQPPYAEALATIRDLEAQLEASHRMRESLLAILNGAIASQGMMASFDARGTLQVAPVATA